MWGVLAGLFLTRSYLEAVYHIAGYGLTGMNPLLFLGSGLVLASVQSLFLGCFRRKGARFLLFFFLVTEYLLYGAQLVYLKIFRQTLQIQAAVQGGGDALGNYWKEALYGIARQWCPLLLMALPLVIWGMVLKKSRVLVRRQKWHRNILNLIPAVTGMGVFVLALLHGQIQENPAVEMYEAYADPKAVMEELGVCVAMQRDLQKVLGEPESEDLFLNLGSLTEEEKPDLEEKEPAPIIPEETSENAEEETELPSEHVLSIPFAELADTEEREAVKALHQYFGAKAPAKTNAYTGMFSGYNLIYLTAEGFAPCCIDETLTPTLYRLTHEGFQFENYYVPLWQTSTSDGEYVNCTGLLPDGQFSMRRSAENFLPTALPWYFAGEGVESLAYHNNSLSYYDRHKTHTNLGYDWNAALLGKLSEEEWGDHVFSLEHPDAWPQSDLEMIQATLPEYVEKERFHVYYLTVSGHLQYTFSGNAMAKKNQELVAELPYSERSKAYIACNIELDRALEALISGLSEAGKLEKTVICLSADHYPYGLENKEIEELLGEPLDEPFALYKNSLILWNAQMEPVVVEKPCSSLDVLPTLLNLFGFSYDSRLYPGNDILSDSAPLVIFSDHSFLTDTYAYDRKKNQAVSFDGQPVAPEELKARRKQVEDLFIVSAGVLKYDYYGTLREVLPQNVVSTWGKP